MSAALFPLPFVLSVAFFIALNVMAQSNVSVSEEQKSGIEANCSSLAEIHNPGLVENIKTDEKDYQQVCFNKYVSSFDKTKVELQREQYWPRALPRWVVQHVPSRDKAKAKSAESYERPNSWFTISELASRRLAPTDDSYKSSASFLNRNGNWYQRGHLAQKYLAERDPDDPLVKLVGASEGGPGWFTHNVANAVPQRARFNRGPWLTLECYTGAWANKYKEGVYIISGPIFLNDRPTEWLRSDNRPKSLPVAVPDALFKVVLRKENDGSWGGLAFIYPQDDPSYKRGPWDPLKWRTSIARVEKLADINVRAADTLFAARKSVIPDTLWQVEKDDFDPSCRRFAPKEPAT